MANTIFIFLFSLIIFPYNGYADSVMSSDENSSDVEKQESVSQQEDSSLNEYTSEDIEIFNASERPDGRAPIGIRGDHVHEQGEFMVSVRTMMMRMRNKVREIRHVKSNDITTGIHKVNIDMWIGMLGLMYGLTDRWTAMAMVPYSLYNVSGGEVDHGFGNMSLSVLYAPLKEDSYKMVLSLEAFFPTGFNSISGVMEEKRKGKNIHYTFHSSTIGLRSTYAFLPKLSTLFYWDKISLGFQVGFKYSIKQTDQFGFEDVLESENHIWGAYNLSENLSVSLRGTHRSGRIAVFGKDFLLEEDRQLEKSRHSFLSSLGFNFIGTRFLAGHRLALEAGVSVYQNFREAMKQSFVVQLGWQKAF